MSVGSRYGVPAFDRPHRMISGVCAAAAILADVPVWMVRVAAVVLLMLHGGLALLFYFGIALIWRQNIRAVLAGNSWSSGPCRTNAWRSSVWTQSRRMP